MKMLDVIADSSKVSGLGESLSHQGDTLAWALGLGLGIAFVVLAVSVALIIAKKRRNR